MITPYKLILNIVLSILDGITLANNLEPDQFVKILEAAQQNISKDKKPDDENDINLEELEKSIGLPNEQFALLAKTISYILKRSLIFIMKPTKLQTELKEIFKLNENKIEIFMKTWISSTKPILDNLEDDDGITKELEDISWKLKVQLSSSALKKEKTVLGQVVLNTTEKVPINLEMNHEEVLDFFNQLENIQTELDLLKK